MSSPDLATVRHLSLELAGLVGRAPVVDAFAAKLPPGYRVHTGAWC